MVLAERKRWPELEALARERISRMPHDGDAWMAFGLAVQRRGNHLAAQAVFDTALARLDTRERAHITSLARVMSPQDTASYLTATEAERALRDRLYWAVNDPLWSRGGSDARTEFLARAAFAEIRWTVEELGVRGIDSDRGEMHVRFGPPDIEAQLSPDPQRAELGGNLSSGSFGSADPIGTTGDAGTDIDRMSSVVTAWAYDGGWLIVFRGAPTYATARIPKEDGGSIDSLVRAHPSSWANASDVTVSEMRSQIARFRGGRDSVDVYLAVEPPVAEIQEAAGTNTAIRANVWLFNLRTLAGFGDSTALPNATPHAWTYRVAPGGYGFRVEATAEGASIAGRATDSILAQADPATGFATRGFGISDPLVARRVVDRGAVTRWRDLDITPTAGTIRKGAEISVVWENYELGDSTGAARYSVAVAIQRQFKGLLPQIRARIIGAYAAFAGVDRTEDRVVMRFERQMRHASTVVDHVEIALEDTPAGNYTLTLEITDHVTAKVAIRSVPFTIRE
jgi:GWxTD domain-containing protein